MSEHPSRVSPREISDFLAELRARSRARAARVSSRPDDSGVLAWKSSILDRIATHTNDPETHAVADQARRDLADARGDLDGGDGSC